MSSDVRKQMNAVPQAYHRTRPQYLAWGILLGRDEKPDHMTATYSTNPRLRIYKYEHLQIAKEILRSAAQNEVFQYWHAAFSDDIAIDICTTKPTTFNHWHLMKKTGRRSSDTKRAQPLPRNLQEMLGSGRRYFRKTQENVTFGGCFHYR